MLKVKFRNSVASAPRLSTTVVGSVQVEVVQFNFDSTWDGLDIWACFINDTHDDKEYHVKMGESREVIVPWECFTVAGNLYIGAIGYRDGEVVKPTTWALTATVEPGVNPDGEISQEPTPNVFEQLVMVVNSKKSAYELAVEFGYVGTEEEYGKTLAEVGEVSDATLLMAMQDMGLVAPTTDENGALLIAEDGVLYTL